MLAANWLCPWRPERPDVADIVDSVTRSRMMAGIRSRNTKPELLVRRHLHSKGLRYRLHVGGLPGTPDIVLAKFNTVVFVHGCFWHQHKRCRFAATPTSNRGFWKNKLAANVIRDRRAVAALRRAGWRVLVLWECQITTGVALRGLARSIKRRS